MKKTVTRPQSRRVESYRRLLLTKRSELVSSLGDGKLDPMARLGRVAEDDQAQQFHDEFISSRMNSMDYEKLKLVQAALDRLTSGEYGVCQACEEPISDKRLQVVPWAQFCLACQERVSPSLYDVTEAIMPAYSGR